MKSSLSLLGFVLILSALILSGCRSSEAQGPIVEVPDEVRAARDAAMAYVIEHYGEQAPAPAPTWREAELTREGQGWTGSVKCDFTSEGRPHRWIAYG